MLQLTALVTSIMMICVPANPDSGKSPYPKLPKHIKDNFVYIPSGDVVIDDVKSELGEFFIKKGEVTNIDYREFLVYLRRTGDIEALQVCTIDSSGWNLDGASFEPFATQYHRNPAYDEYPVVNISHEAAELYCTWLEKMLNNSLDGLYEVEVRLPDHTEWRRAADPNNNNSRYAWGGPYLRNAKGCYMCNFYPKGAESITRDLETGEFKVVGSSDYFAPVTLAPALSYVESQSGVFNLNGNAAEMVSKPGIAIGGSWASTGYDVRNESVIPFEKPSPYVGFRPVLTIK